MLSRFKGVIFFIFISTQVFSQYNPKTISGLRKNLKTTPDSLIGKIYNKLFTEFYSHSAFDSAVSVSEEAVIRAQQIKDRKFESTALVWEGMVEFERGNYDKTVELYVQALKIKDQIKDLSGESSVLINLASVYYERNHPDKAIELFKQALSIKIRLNDKKGQGTVLSNLGNIAQSEKQFKEAIKYYLQSKKLIQEEKDTLQVAIVNRALASANLNVGNIKDAEMLARQALSVLRNYNNRHFTQCLTLLGKIYYEKKDYNRSVEFLLEGYENGLKNKTPFLSLESCEYLVKSYEKLKQLDKSLSYQKLYSQINDSLLGIKMGEQLADMQVKYETEKKEKAIEHLDKENGKKELELTKKKNQLLIISAVSFCIVLILIAFYFYHDAKQQKQITHKEKELSRLKVRKQKEIIETIIKTEEKERKKIAADLHDGLGQILTAAKINLANLNSEELKGVTDLVNSALYESKAMALNLMPLTLKENGLTESIKHICTKGNKPGEQEITFSAHNIPEKLEPIVEINTYRICQELLNNALKYSKATKIFLQLFCRENKLIIQIEDNGVGFDKTKVKQDSLGMNTLKERVALLSGEIEIESAPNKGTNIFIELSL